MAERKFRDGKREIPDYMDDLMAGLDTSRMTYDQAVVAMNHEMIATHLDRAVDQITDRHFRELGSK